MKKLFYAGMLASAFLLNAFAEDSVEKTAEPIQVVCPENTDECSKGDNKECNKTQSDTAVVEQEKNLKE